MRKFILFLLLLLFAPFMVFGADGEYYTDEARQILDSSIEITDSLRGEYAELEKQILALDPDYAKYLQSKKKLTDEQKLTMARSYLAQKAFDYYKDTFMAELEQHSKETGRKIVTESFKPKSDGGIYDHYESWWLDRGTLDTDDCKLHNEWQQLQICKYPDNFEEHAIYIQEIGQKDKNGKKARSGNNLYAKSIAYDKDIRDKNAHQICLIDLQYESINHYSITDSNHYSIAESVVADEVALVLSCDVTKYDEYSAWRNQEVEDTINGKHDIIRTEKMSDGQVRLVQRQEEDMSKWQSNYLPDGYVMGRVYTQSYQKEHHIIEGAE